MFDWKVCDFAHFELGELMAKVFKDLFNSIQFDWIRFNWTKLNSTQFYGIDPNWKLENARRLVTLRSAAPFDRNHWAKYDKISILDGEWSRTAIGIGSNPNWLASCWWAALANWMIKNQTVIMRNPAELRWECDGWRWWWVSSPVEWVGGWMGGHVPAASIWKSNARELLCKRSRVSFFVHLKVTFFPRAYSSWESYLEPQLFQARGSLKHIISSDTRRPILFFERRALILNLIAPICGFNTPAHLHSSLTRESVTDRPPEALHSPTWDKKWTRQRRHLWMAKKRPEHGSWERKWDESAFHL